jgi:hypothetical protein
LTYAKSLVMNSIVVMFLAMALTEVVVSTSGPRTFHVKGMISGPRNSIAAGVKVEFDDGKNHTAATTDAKGLYAVELPVGSYTMTRLRSTSFPCYVSKNCYSERYSLLRAPDLRFRRAWKQRAIPERTGSCLEERLRRERPFPSSFRKGSSVSDSCSIPKARTHQPRIFVQKRQDLRDGAAGPSFRILQSFFA